ncbi:hypothetical protein BN8_03785 [Fibrisoma limi BUZ 3]|uniref:Uncharacterized protein n=1 Tax=Fibrisoma limi BUZ 3 TaxID=1185876 RepID=I2GL21_9BACT|nr:hypothetical protein BN8_03785 [Fibrisoma limi BUZ 3]
MYLINKKFNKSPNLLQSLIKQLEIELYLYTR